jgi:sugar lactone lactonase YvrE
MAAIGVKLSLGQLVLAALSAALLAGCASRLQVEGIAVQNSTLTFSGGSSGLSWAASSSGDWILTVGEPLGSSGVEVNGKAYQGPVNLGRSTSATITLPENTSATNQVYSLALSNSAQVSFLASATVTVDHPVVVTFIAPGGSDGGLDHGRSLAIDSRGNVWAAGWPGYFNGTLFEAPLGSEPAGLIRFPVTVSGVTALDEPYSLAADQQGNLWVANAAFDYNYNGTGAGQVIEIPAGSAPSSAPLVFANPSSGSPFFGGPRGIAVDGSGNVWVANYANNTVTEIPAGSAPGNFSPSVFNSSGSTSVFDGPKGIAVDSSGNVWVTNQLGNTVTEIPTGSAPATFKPVIFANPSSGSPFFAEPYGIAIDQKGNVWVVDDREDNGHFGASNTVTEIPAGSSTPVVFPANWFDGGAESVTVDGAGNVWVGTQYGVTEIPAGSSPSSAPVIFSPKLFGANTYGLNGISVDQQGNLWVLNTSQGSLQELLQAAAPLPFSVPPH